MPERLVLEATERGEPIAGARRRARAETAPSGAIDRALLMLEALAAGGESVGVTEIARRVGLPKSVVHYHLAALARRGFAELRPDRRYRLGAAAMGLGRVLSASHRLRQLARSHLVSIHERTWETATLSLLVGTECVYVEQLPSPHPYRTTVELGGSFPLHVGASSRAILAFLPEAARDSLLGRRLARVTPKTPVDPRWLREDLERVRESGVADSRGERWTGFAALAAPLFDSRGVVGAIGVCAPADRFDAEAERACRGHLKREAARLSRDLGSRLEVLN